VVKINTDKKPICMVIRIILFHERKYFLSRMKAVTMSGMITGKSVNNKEI